MIFKEKLCQKVLDGEKTQTRRLVKEGDFSVEWPMVCVFGGGKGNRLRFRENQTYAVQPGRGKKAVGRIGIIKIRKEKLQKISPADIIAESISTTLRGYAAETHLYSQFRELWDSIHPKGKRWEDNPECWVLEFELIS